METHSDKLAKLLLVSGMLLFLLGLMNGGIIPFFTNPRMGLASHMAGTQNGMVLLISGLFWPRISLSPLLRKAACGLNIFGMYTIWVALFFAGVWGTSRATPIAGAGFEASPLKETIIQIECTIGSIAALGAAALMLAGLIKTPAKA